MQKPLRMFVIALAAVMVVTPALASGNLNFVVGTRNIDTGEDDFDEVEDQTAFGVNWDFKTGDLPFNWVVGFHLSGEEENVDLGGFTGDVSTSLIELSFGPVWIWETGSARPYVGGGLSYIQASLDVDIGPVEFDEDDQSPAAYLDGGIYWRLGEVFNLGVGARIVEGSSFDLGGEDFEADYQQAHILFGWGWD